MDRLWQQFARLIVGEGVNIQPGQMLVINAPIAGAAFARQLAASAFDAGAADVQIFWDDEQVTKLRLERAPISALEDFPAWQSAARMHYMRDKGACVVSIYAEDPALLRDVDADKAAALFKARAQAFEEYRGFMMANKARWCVVSVPTPGWAKAVFPDMPEAVAMEALARAIFKATRADMPDPIAAWRAHDAETKQRIARMNELRFSALHFTSGNGTDLTVGLADEHIWCGGTEHDMHGVPFSPNIPTEEMFTAPHRDRVEGIVYSTKPLLYHGLLIEDFSLTFRGGRIVDYTARAGADTLGHLLDTDEGSRHIGEVALVAYDSPINATGLLFYNTLFDENASCHLALGKSYPMNFGGEDRGQAALDRLGYNTSLNHEDFMIGARDTAIDGITPSGERVPVFRDGNFVL